MLNLDLKEIGVKASFQVEFSKEKLHMTFKCKKAFSICYKKL